MPGLHERRLFLSLLAKHCLGGVLGVPRLWMRIILRPIGTPSEHLTFASYGQMTVNFWPWKVIDSMDAVDVFPDILDAPLF